MLATLPARPPPHVATEVALDVEPRVLLVAPVTDGLERLLRARGVPFALAAGLAAARRLSVERPFELLVVPARIHGRDSVGDAVSLATTPRLPVLVVEGAELVWIRPGREAEDRSGERVDDVIVEWLRQA